MKLRIPAALIVFTIIALLIGALIASAADELKLSSGWQYAKNGRSRIVAATTVNYDIAGDAVIENVQSIATNAGGEALILGDVTAPGFAWFHNLDPTNMVRVGVYDVNTNLVVFLELRAGEKTATWLGVTAPRAIAVTNAVKLDYMITDR